MKWEMEILSPSSYLSSSSWLLDESKSTIWTPAENKMFENALAIYDKDTPDRWQKVAARIPGKTVGDVMRHYKELEDDVSSIEAGLIPIPGYCSSSTSAFTLDCGGAGGGSGDDFDGFRQFYGPGCRRGSLVRSSDHEKKKGVPWTEEEHKLFLMGLKKYGKGDWRNISRNFVVTRTPTQVASHAQKYFIRQISGGKDKRRASIHDITTVNLNDSQIITPPETKRRPVSPDPTRVRQLQKSCSMPIRTCFEWPGSAVSNNSYVSSSPYESNSNNFGFKMEGRDQVRAGESFFGASNIVFQMQSAHHYPHG